MLSLILTALFAGAASATEAIYLANGQDSYTPCKSFLQHECAYIRLTSLQVALRAMT